MPAEPAGEAPARARDGRVRAARLVADAQGRRAHPVGHQREPARGGRGGPLPPGPAVPAEHDRDPRPAAARAARGHPRARAALPEAARAALPEGRPGASIRRALQRAPRPSRGRATSASSTTRSSARRSSRSGDIDPGRRTSGCAADGDAADAARRDEPRGRRGRPRSRRRWPATAATSATRPARSASRAAPSTAGWRSTGTDGDGQESRGAGGPATRPERDARKLSHERRVFLLALVAALPALRRRGRPALDGDFTPQGPVDALGCSSPSSWLALLARRCATASSCRSRRSRTSSPRCARGTSRSARAARGRTTRWARS